jgi:hypothetical protein
MSEFDMPEPLSDRTNVIHLGGGRWVAHRHDRFGRHWTEAFASKAEAESWLVELIAGMPSTRTGGSAAPAARAASILGRPARRGQPTAPCRCVWAAQEYPSFSALAKRLAPFLNKSPTAIYTRLRQFAGDGDRVVASYQEPPPRPPRPTDAEVKIAGQQALSRHLAEILDQPIDAVRTQLENCNGDAAKVVEFYTATAAMPEPEPEPEPEPGPEAVPTPPEPAVQQALAEPRAEEALAPGPAANGPTTGPIPMESEPPFIPLPGTPVFARRMRPMGRAPRGVAKPCSFRGVGYRSHTALSEHLAAATGHSPQVTRAHLTRFAGDGERTITFLRQLVPDSEIAPPQPPFRYAGGEFATKSSLAHCLAAHTGQPFSLVMANLRFSDGDIDALVALLRALPLPAAPASPPEPPPPSPLLQKISEPPDPVVPDLRQTVARLERMVLVQGAALARLQQQRRDTGEAVPRLQRRVTTLERHVGLVETPQTPRSTRRHPMEA